MKHAPFLRAIAQAPHDDLPRLVYADALEESGVPEQVARAHFIRGQIELIAPSQNTPEIEKIQDSVNTLKNEYEDTWMWKQLPLFCRSLSAMDWKRGCVEAIAITVGDLIEHGEVLFELLPILDLKIKLRGNETVETGIFETRGFLSNITTLRLGQYYVHNGRFRLNTERERTFFNLFMTARTWRDVTSLHFTENLVDDVWIQRFAELMATSSLIKLEQLSLSSCTTVGIEGVKTITTLQCFRDLRSLQLWEFPNSNGLRAKLVRQFGARVEFKSLGQ